MGFLLSYVLRPARVLKIPMELPTLFHQLIIAGLVRFGLGHDLVIVTLVGVTGSAATAGVLEGGASTMAYWQHVV